MPSTIETLQNLLRNLASDETVPSRWSDIKLNADMLINDLDIDSLSLTSLSLDIEDALNLSLPEEGLANFRCVGDLVAYIDGARENPH